MLMVHNTLGKSQLKEYSHWLCYQMGRGVGHLRQHNLLSGQVSFQTHFLQIWISLGDNKWSGNSLCQQPLTRVFDRYNFSHQKSCSYYPSANGQTESTNKVLIRENLLTTPHLMAISGIMSNLGIQNRFQGYHTTHFFPASIA